MKASSPKESDETESVFVDKTLAHAQEFTSVFRRLVQSKRFLAELGLDVRELIVEFGAQSVAIPAI